MKNKEENSGIIFAIIIFGGLFGGWCAIIGSLIKFIIDGINYFS